MNTAEMKTLTINETTYELVDGASRQRLDTVEDKLRTFDSDPSNEVSGEHAAAFGSNTSAQGNSSVAMGNQTKAEGDASIALGSGTVAHGPASIAMGTDSVAVGNSAIALGRESIAGCKGYYISEIDVNNSYIYLNKTDVGDIPTYLNDPALVSEFYDPSFESGYIMPSPEEEPLEFCVSANAYYHWPFMGTITAIDGNCLTYSAKLSPTQLSYWEGATERELKPFIFYVPKRPDVGRIGIGVGSVSEGWETYAAGDHSHAEGWNTVAAGRYAHAEGDSTRAGFAAHAEGEETLALGLSTHAEGYQTIAHADYAHAEGLRTIAYGYCSHAEGRSYSKYEYDGDLSAYKILEDYAAIENKDHRFSIAFGNYSHVEGDNCLALKAGSHAEGSATVADNYFAHAEGELTTSKGEASHSEGYQTTASSFGSHAEGRGTQAIGEASHSEGRESRAKGDYSHAEGFNNEAHGDYSHAEGGGATEPVLAEGTASHAEGGSTHAAGDYSHAEGFNTMAGKDYSHAEGFRAKAGGDSSHAEGYNTCASGDYSHAEGYSARAYTGSLSVNDVLTSWNLPDSAKFSIACGYASHVEGSNNLSLGYHTHAEGCRTIAQGIAAHAEGVDTAAIGNYSHSEGLYTRANGSNQHVQGKYNAIDNDNNYAHIVGNGDGDSEKQRRNIHTLDWKGKAWFQDSVSSFGADYAEFFEWEDGNPEVEDRVGRAVTLHGEKIAFANVGDPILGIISGTAAVLGDNAECAWKHKYLTDKFGRIIYDMVEEFHTEIDPETGEETQVSIGLFPHPRLNPDYDPNKEYVPREDRPEWDKVGMLGKIHAIHDGTCVPGCYATVTSQGCFTHTDEKTNVYVMSAVADNVAIVLFK